MQDASDGMAHRAGSNSRESWREPVAAITAAGFVVLIPIVIVGLLAARVVGVVPFWVMAAAVPTSTLLYYTLLFTLSWSDIDPSLTPSSRSADSTELRNAEAPQSAAARNSSTNEAGTGRGAGNIASLAHLVAVSLRTIFASAMFAFGSYVLLRWTVTAFPRVLQFVIFAFAALYLLFAARALATSRGRAIVLHEELRSIGSYGIAGRVATFMAIFVNVFGAGAAWLAQLHLVHLHDAASAGAPGVDRVIEFFGWHALDAIPVLEVTKTMNWQVPLTYDGATTGSLLLLFKVIFLFAMLKLVIEAVKAVQ